MPLSAKNREKLEDAALLAFLGKATNIKDGMAIRNEFGPVATVYWGGLQPGNDVEISLADSRLSEHYDLLTVQRWVKREVRALDAKTIARGQGNDLPAFGFSFEAAMTFLSGCRSVRLGILSNSIFQELQDISKLETPAEKKLARLERDLSTLRPMRHQAVIDLVRKAAVDVSRWYRRADGAAAAMPRSNPAFCYNWAFGGGEEPSVGCFWFRSIKIDSGAIQIQANLREWALKLERIVEAGRDEEARDRARSQAKRARKLDELLRNAAAGDGEVRVIIVEGDMASEEQIGRESSVVRLRHLDPEPWHIASYDQLSGACLLIRNGPKEPTEPAASQVHDELQYEDQHGTPGTDMPPKVPVSGAAYLRDPAVRTSVLERSNGHCEYCDALGFRTSKGRLYLETHHVIPLSENGKDRVWNVAALCPNHHREAHSGELAPVIRTALLEFLADTFPFLTRESENTDRVQAH